MGISSRSYDDIGAEERSLPTLHKKAGGLTRNSRDTDASQDRQFEVSSVAFKIVRQFILTRKPALSHGKWQPGQRVVLRGGKQPQGVPAAAPSVAGALIGIYDDEGATRKVQMIPGGET